MKVEETKKTDLTKLLIKKCHVCGHIMESSEEVQKCHKCKKSFLPSNYFHKVHSKNQKEYEALFAGSHEIHEQDLIKGLTVLW
jgi:tRNA(Ile2) C34 agmatinyltransferase TiaS